MATQPTGRVVEPLPAPQHYAPPTLRELRAQAVQRLQVGLFGIAAMLLLVGPANIIMERARLVDRQAGVDSKQVANGQPKNDPLADIGVIPSPDASKPPPSAAPQRPAN